MATSLISGSYSRVPETGGAALLSEVMVENDEAATKRAVAGVEAAALRAIGLTALDERADR